MCSFEYSHDPSDHRGRCEQCKKEGHRDCVAGPRPGITRTRLRIGPDGEPYRNKVSVSKKPHKISTCRQCLDLQRICSFASQTSRSSEVVCTACEMFGLLCEPPGMKKTGAEGDQHPALNPSAGDTLSLSGLSMGDDIVSTSSNPLGGHSAEDEIVTISSSPPQPPVSDNTRQSLESTPDPRGSSGDTGGTVKTVRTRFCHPMCFDYQDKTRDGSDPCHFCSSAYFGHIGLEERTTEVIEWYDGRGWEEISGGHKGDNVKGSQMCTPCIMARMQIMVCSDHALRRVPEPNSTEDHEAAFGRLLDPEQTHGGDRWCSVCCNLAAWECCMAQELEPGEGCGLALCEPCVKDLQKCGGSLETMLQALEDKPSEARPAGLRADYELLKEDGLLMRYLISSTTT